MAKGSPSSAVKAWEPGVQLSNTTEHSLSVHPHVKGFLTDKAPARSFPNRLEPFHSSRAVRQEVLTAQLSHALSYMHSW